MSENDMVTFSYSSMKNVSFQGEVETGITVGEWDEMSERERNEVVSDVVHNLVEVSPINVEW
jgi:AAA+ ATPase superfamily predicted ATPase